MRAHSRESGNVHRQIVDAGECRLEFTGAEPNERLGELAVDGIAAI